MFKIASVIVFLFLNASYIEAETSTILEAETSTTLYPPNTPFSIPTDQTHDYMSYYHASNSLDALHTHCNDEYASCYEKIGEPGIDKVHCDTRYDVCTRI